MAIQVLFLLFACIYIGHESDATVEKNEHLKDLAHDFIRRLRSECRDQKVVVATLSEFISNLKSGQTSVLNGLVAIGADQSERTLDRNFALAQFAGYVHFCGMQNDKNLEMQLSGIIDDWLKSSPPQHLRTAGECALTSRGTWEVPCWGALLALGAVNRLVGLEKCDYVIEHYGESDAALRIREIRATITRSKPKGGTH